MTQNIPITDAALAELDRLHAAATIGDWKYTPIANWVSAENGRVVCDAAVHRNHRIADADGAWIAASKNAFPAILAYVRELEEALEVERVATINRDAQQRREGAAEALLDLANDRFGDGLFLPGDRTNYTAAQVSEILTAEARRLREGK